MRHFRVRKHDQFQHYKNRNPPWIMLHLRLFGSQRFLALTDGQKWQALALALVASRYDNHLPDNPQWLREETHSKQPIDLEALFSAKFIVWCKCEECASKLQQDASGLLQDACSEESIGEQSTPHQTSAANGRDEVAECFEAHLEARRRFFHQRNGKNPPAPPTLTAARRKKIRDAIRVHGYDKARAAGIGIFLSDFHTGKNDREELYLSPEIAWRMPNKAGNGTDNVDKLADVFFRKKEHIR